MHFQTSTLCNPYSAQSTQPRSGVVWLILTALLALGLQAPVWAQDSPGSEDLDAAFDKKIQAQSTRDLEGVVKLCKSAIEKGLDEEGLVQAKQLAASASMEHAEQLAKRIFQTPQDPRWQKFRGEALLQLKQATEFQPSLVSAHLTMARLNLLPNGSMEAAREAVEQAVTNAGEDREQLSQALFFRAQLNEDKEAKLADVNQALKINPDNLDALKFRAVYYLSNNESEKGMADVNQWLSTESATPQDFIDTLVLLRAMGKSFDDALQLEALKIIERGLKLAPEDVRFLEQRAEIYVIRKELDQAIEDLNTLINSENKDPQTQTRKMGYRLLRGQLFNDQEKWDQAIADFDTILKANPSLMAALQARGATLAAKGDFAGSIKDFQRMQSRMEGPNPALMRQIAILHNANDEPSQAVKIYNDLLDLLAEEKFENQSDEVKREAEQERQATWRSRGDAYLSLGKHKEAIEDYNKVLEIQQTIQEFAKQDSEEEIPDDEHTLNNLAWVLATSTIDELRDGKRAVELATQAAEATEFKEAYIISTLASAYAESGDFENALKWIDKAIELNAQDRQEKETERNLEQQASLQTEKEHYQRKEAFREMQNVEEEKAAKEKEAKEKEADSAKDSPEETKEDPDQDKPKAEDKDGDKGGDKGGDKAEDKENDKEKGKDGEKEDEKKNGKDKDAANLDVLLIACVP